MPMGPDPTRTHDRSHDARERRVIVLGSTGSVGTQTLDVIEHLNALHERGASPLSFRVVGLSAGSNAQALARQASMFRVADVAIGRSNEDIPGLRTLNGPDAAERLVRSVECDLVVAAMVGVAGLPATMEAISLGRDVALANKETLVAAGSVVIPAAARRGVRLLPLDSEHAALWLALAGVLPPSQCPPVTLPNQVKRVVLTASGGPFRTTPVDEMRRAGPDLALRHPTWSMGAKVTVDSASMMNKALEVIEAHWLFGAPAERITVSVHPQSVIHAMVELVDGSVVAQMASPDMRLPIQQALTHPARLPSLAPPITWHAPARLELEPPDTAKFRALDLATRVIGSGGSTGAVLNAANEVAVDAFLGGRIPFGRITPLVEETLDRIPTRPIASIADALDADAEARDLARRRLAHQAPTLTHG